MKWNRIIVLGIVALCLAGCGEDEKVEGNEVEEPIVEDTVQVTLDAEFFTGQDEETIKEDAENQGMLKAEVNKDGSVVYTLTKQRHDEIINEYKEEIDFAVSDIAKSDTYPSIKKIKTKDDYKTFNIYVDKALFEKSGDMLATITLYIASSYYHAFKNDGDELKVTLNYIDEKTDKKIQTLELPKDEEKVE